MSGNFDPYRQWLGIEVGSPNYFELLELPLSETDPEKIAIAANTQLNKVRAIRPAEQIHIWTKLIDEIKEAEKCLLDANYRKAYLAGLSAGESKPLPQAELVDASEIEVVPTAVSEFQNADGQVENENEIEVSETISEPEPVVQVAAVDGPSPVKIEASKRRKKKPWKVMAIGHVIITLSMVGLAYYLFVYSKQKDPENSDDSGFQHLTQNGTGELPETKLDKNKIPGIEKKNKKSKDGNQSKKSKSKDGKGSNAKKGDRDKEKDKSTQLFPDLEDELTPAFRFYVLKYLRNLEFRQFTAARDAEKRFREIKHNAREKQFMKRLDAAMTVLEGYWENVMAQAEKIPAGAELTVEGREHPMIIVEADREKIVFRYAGGNRYYYTNFVPNLVAEALLDRQLGKRSTDFNLQVNVFRALHEFKKPGSLKGAIGELKKITDETEDAQLAIDFFEKEWPHLFEVDVVEKVSNAELKTLSKSVSAKHRLKPKKPVPAEFFGKAVQAESKQSQAMLQLAIDRNAKAGDVGCLDALDWMERLTSKKDPKVILRLCKDFPKKKGKHWDAYFFAQRVLNLLDSNDYGWSKSQKQAVLKEISSLAINYKFANLTRAINNRSK